MLLCLSIISISKIEEDASTSIRTGDDGNGNENENEHQFHLPKKKRKRTNRNSKYLTKIQTRNSTELNGRFKSKWKENMVVMAKLDDELKNWERGKIVTTFSSHHDSSTMLRIELLDSKRQIVIPREHINSRVREIDLFQDSLSGDVMKQTVYRMLKKWMTDDEKKSIRDEFTERGSDFKLENVLDKLFSTNGKEACFDNFAERMVTQDEFARTIIQKATGETGMENDPLLLLCVFMGRIIGIDLQVLLEKGTFKYHFDTICHLNLYIYTG